MKFARRQFWKREEYCFLLKEICTYIMEDTDLILGKVEVEESAAREQLNSMESSRLVHL